MSEFKLDVRQLSKAYGDVLALEAADLHIMEGEFVTLLGPSGSGKTTLLSIVAGLRQPTSGEVWIDGTESTYAPPHQRDLGMVFQNYALFPHMSVTENIAFPLKMRTRLSEREVNRRAAAALEAVRLPGIGDRMPAELSGGQQQRVALARCMVYEPSIILMDEPLGALDKNLREELQLEIKSLHTRLGITVLYVTHDQDEAMTMSDRICLMTNARIEQIGPPQELYTRPCSLFAAKFFGDSNALSGKVIANDDYLEIETNVGLVRAEDSNNNISVGSPATAVIRPERIRIESQWKDEPGLGTMAKVEQIIFTAGLCKYYLRHQSGESLVATTLTDSAAPRVQVGDEVAIACERDAIIVVTK